MSFAIEERLPPGIRRLGGVLLYVGWLAIVAWFALHHEFWRDEVRALSFATSGSNVVEMVRTMHGDSHPTLWYFLLRAGHALIGNSALPLIAFVIGAAASLLLVWKGPFSLIEKGFLLFTKFMVFEYVVMARNYGISILLMFLFAIFYRRWRERGVGLGIILALLANTNVHSALLAGALMLFWMLDVARERGLSLGKVQLNVVLNGVILSVGIVLCLLTIYPPMHDSIESPSRSLAQALQMFANPGGAFKEFNWGSLPLKVLSVLLLLSPLRFLNDWAKFAAAVAGFGALMAVFYLLYGGGYRHEALLLGFYITLIWIDRAEPQPRVGRGLLRFVGVVAFSLLIALQTISGLHFLYVLTKLPMSSSRHVGELIRQNPQYAHSVVLADVDYFVEPLVYYAPGLQPYLPREQRDGRYVKFVKRARLDQSLGDLLADARRLQAERGVPVLILLSHPLNASEPTTAEDSYNWIYRTTPEQVRCFTASTTLLRAREQTLTDESYDVFVLNPGRPPGC